MLVTRCHARCVDTPCSQLRKTICHGLHREGCDIFATCGACPTAKGHLCRPGAPGFPSENVTSELSVLPIRGACEAYLSDPMGTSIAIWQTARRLAGMRPFTDSELEDPGRRRVIAWFGFEGGLKGLRPLGCRAKNGVAPLTSVGPAAACAHRPSILIYYVVWKCANDFITQNLDSTFEKLQRGFPKDGAVTTGPWAANGENNFAAIESEYVRRSADSARHFTFVREPYAHFLSGYNEAVMGTWATCCDPAAKHQGREKCRRRVRSRGSSRG